MAAALLGLCAHYHRLYFRVSRLIEPHRWLPDPTWSGHGFHPNSPESAACHHRSPLRVAASLRRKAFHGGPLPTAPARIGAAAAMVGRSYRVVDTGDCQNAVSPRLEQDKRKKQQ